MKKPVLTETIATGQGTIGLEIAAQLATLETPADAVLVPCGGGGLVSRIALALNSALPGVPVYAVEPAAFDDTRRSLVAGSRLANDPAARSICDALLAPTPGEITFALNHQLLAGGLTASDEAAHAAMAAAFDAFKIVVEPGGAVALAAALTGQLDIGGKTVVVVASGGNVDPTVFTGALAA